MCKKSKSICTICIIFGKKFFKLCAKNLLTKS
nr:MAG TPA: hypothetical protein [Caudoviricetes sp.]